MQNTYASIAEALRITKTQAPTAKQYYVALTAALAHNKWTLRRSWFDIAMRRTVYTKDGKVVIVRRKDWSTINYNTDEIETIYRSRPSSIGFGLFRADAVALVGRLDATGEMNLWLHPSTSEGPYALLVG